MRSSERGDRALVRQVEAVERLVEQQQSRRADERPRDQQPLLLAARALADRPPRVAGRADELDRLLDALRAAAVRPGQRQAPAGAVEAEPDEVDAADPGRRVEGVPLRQVADLAAVACPAARRAPRPCPRVGLERPSSTRAASTCRRRSARARRRTRPARSQSSPSAPDRAAAACATVDVRAARPAEARSRGYLPVAACERA